MIEWRKIEGWPYSVSNDGHVRNDRTGYVLKMHKMPKGYMKVLLCDKGDELYKTVHRLVAEAFIPNPDGKPQVNHIDGDKQNNHVSNLEWVTNSENQLHSWDVLGKTPAVGNPFNRKPVRCVETGDIYESAKDAAKSMGVYRSVISDALRGRQKSSAGCRWEYVRRVGDDLMETMANDVIRPIDAAPLIADGWVLEKHGVSNVIIGRKSLADVPTIDPESLRPKGRWEIHCRSTYDSWTQETDEEFCLECSECKRQVWDVDYMAVQNDDRQKLIEKYPYCHCGCKMEG